ncbi:MAG TPA: hypothetical protein VH518_18490, partial [Tepidisphaeraceae bacterium]
MRSTSWLHNRNPSAPVTRPRNRTSPYLEAIEGRRLFSTLTVTNLQDSGAGSLRAEIAAAQNGDTIVFSSTLPSSTPMLSYYFTAFSSPNHGHGKHTPPPPPPPPPPP